MLKSRKKKRMLQLPLEAFFKLGTVKIINKHFKLFIIFEYFKIVSLLLKLALFCYFIAQLIDRMF